MPEESRNYLHKHPQFSDLLRIVADNMSIDPSLVEKDYWIMHCLYGLQQQSYDFHLKGGTSLSKGFGLIHRFSEDIDIRIDPPASIELKVGKNHNKEAHRKGRKNYYDGLANEINIDGVASVERDVAFDDIPGYRSAGIRLRYDSAVTHVGGLKDGILLELGFDDVTPSIDVDISSWAYDAAVEAGVEIIDNRALSIACYDPCYTFVEKLQAISTKFRKQQESGQLPTNFIRHYYDVYQLLNDDRVKAFIGSEEYTSHKAKRFPKADEQDLSKNEAFTLSDPSTRELYKAEYQRTQSLYYQGQPDFDDILSEIQCVLIARLGNQVKS